METTFPQKTSSETNGLKALKPDRNKKTKNCRLKKSFKHIKAFSLTFQVLRAFADAG